MTAIRALSAPRSRLKPYSARPGQPAHYSQPAHYPTQDARRTRADRQHTPFRQTTQLNRDEIPTGATLIERPSHADTSPVECSNAGVNAHMNSTLDLYTVAARADRRSTTIPSLRRSDETDPRHEQSRAPAARSPDRTHALTLPAQITPVQSIHARTHRVGAVHVANRVRAPRRTDATPTSRGGRTCCSCTHTRPMLRAAAVETLIRVHPDLSVHR